MGLGIGNASAEATSQANKRYLVDTLVLGLFGHQTEPSTFTQNQALPCRQIEGFQAILGTFRHSQAKSGTARYLALRGIFRHFAGPW